MPLDILRANQQSSCLVLAMHVQLCLDQSHSKILKIAVTPEKCELLSLFFFFLLMDIHLEELQINVVFSRSNPKMVKSVTK